MGSLSESKICYIRVLLNKLWSFLIYVLYFDILAKQWVTVIGWVAQFQHCC